MALLRYIDGKNAEVSAETGARIWRILNGEEDAANDKEEAICLKVSKIYLNYRNAPNTYIQQNLVRIIPMVMAAWMVDSTPNGNYQHTSRGKTTKPQPSDTWNIAFCKKWGLIDNFGRPTALARKYM